MKKRTPAILFLSFLTINPLQAEDPSFEPWAYTGKDVYPSALIATATVNWHEETDGEETEAEEEAEEEVVEEEPKGKGRHKKERAEKEAAEEAEADAEPEEEVEQALVLGDPNSWFGARLYNIPAGAKVKVEVSGEGWLRPSRSEVVVEEETDEVIVMPKCNYDFAALGKIRQQRPAIFSIKVSINGKKLPDQTETVILRSINECPFFIHFENEESDDLSWMFAAYVNENHPWIDSILKEALEAGLVDSFDGYQSGDPKKVVAQVYAIWHVLQRKGIRYSDITATPRSKYATAQTVRFLDDSVKGAQANCVDGSVIFASILTKISIKCGLVLVPGHCFIAFDLSPEGTLDPTSETCLGLETTMLGADKLKPLAELKKLPEEAKVKAETAENKASQKTFWNAIETAEAVFSEHGESFLDDSAGLDYQVVAIDDARELGIMPLAAPEK